MCNWKAAAADEMFKGHSDLPQYGPMFFWMLKTLAKYFGALGQEIKSVSTAEAVDKIMDAEISV